MVEENLIRVMPKALAERIAAGEVVERPASAAKELVENALDAGAKHITVELRRGGIEYLRVTDDGKGIPMAEVPTAFLRHATSKLYEESQMTSIATLGFRGEALAAIGAVARVEMLTKPRGETFGCRYVMKNGAEECCERSGCPDGTTVIVRDLFADVPARYKFLKKDSAEGSAIHTMVRREAIGHPEVSFRVLREGKTVLHTAGDGTEESVLVSAMEEKPADFLHLDGRDGALRLRGFVSKPSACKGTRAGQFFYINGRWVWCKILIAALENAYKNRMMVGRFPACALYLDLPYEEVDVNSHPAKTEVRFADESRIYRAVYHCVSAALDSAEDRPELGLSRGGGRYAGLNPLSQIPAARPSAPPSAPSSAPASSVLSSSFAPSPSAFAPSSGHMGVENPAESSTSSSPNVENFSPSRPAAWTLHQPRSVWTGRLPEGDFSSIAPAETQGSQTAPAASAQAPQAESAGAETAENQGPQAENAGRAAGNDQESQAEFAREKFTKNQPEQAAFAGEKTGKNQSEQAAFAGEKTGKNQSEQADFGGVPIAKGPQESARSAEGKNAETPEAERIPAFREEAGDGWRWRKQEGLLTEEERRRDLAWEAEKLVRENGAAAEAALGVPRGLSGGKLWAEAEKKEEIPAQTTLLETISASNSPSTPLAPSFFNPDFALDPPSFRPSAAPNPPDFDPLSTPNRPGFDPALSSNRSDPLFGENRFEGGRLSTQDGGEACAAFDRDAGSGENQNLRLHQNRDDLDLGRDGGEARAAFDRDAGSGENQNLRSGQDREVSAASNGGEGREGRVLDRFPSPYVEQEGQEPWRMVCELFHTYIVIEQGENVLFIDKHAAHERLGFDRLKDRAWRPMRQELLAPQALRVSPEQKVVLLEHVGNLEEFGYVVQDFGGDNLVLRAIPDFLSPEEAPAALEELADEILSVGSANPAAARDSMLHTMACKAAVKGGQKSAPAELLALAKAVMRGEVTHCPHGRPVMTVLSRKELEKSFKRIL